MANEKKGITVKIDAALHAEIRQFIEENGMTMAEFVSQALYNELHPKIQPQEVKNMGPMRTMAFQMPEDMFQRLKDYLHRHNITQKEFVLGLVEAELNRDQELRNSQNAAAENTTHEENADEELDEEESEGEDIDEDEDFDEEMDSEELDEEESEEEDIDEDMDSEELDDEESEDEDFDEDMDSEELDEDESEGEDFNEDEDSEELDEEESESEVFSMTM